MVAGALFMVAAMFAFRPAMRNPVLFALFLLNPLLWNGVTQFQLTTIWAFAFFFLGAWQFEKRRNVVATGLFGVGIACHPMMGLAALGLFAAWETLRMRRLPVRLVACGVVAAAMASPFIWLFLSTPSIGDATTLRVALSFFDNLRRLSIVLLALALPPLAPWVYRQQRWLPLAAGAATATVLVFVPPSGWWETSQPRFAEYLAAHPVDPSASYRVASKNNHEDGMVQFMKAGATLANEFFTESEQRHTWSSPQTYECFLATKQIDRVVISGEYNKALRDNEVLMLDALVSAGRAEKEFAGSDGTVAYVVRPAASARRSSLRDCHL
jgi:hypothetical protein